MTQAAAALGGRLAELGAKVEARLPELLPPHREGAPPVREAMHYALTGRGKRLRPILTLVVAEICGSRFSQAPPPVVDLGCAVEMVHACSLIFDDLPAQDDAEMRRGRPTVHKVYGEDMAQLAGLGLLSRAYAVVAECGQRLPLKRYSSEDMVHHLAAAIGTAGLIAGQALDLRSDPAELDLERLETIHSQKTGALFIAAGELGAMAADARRRDLDAITRYAKNLGLAFQITDDLLDVTATSDQIGKDADQDRDKVTFVKLLGVEGARTLAEELLDFAIVSLDRASFARRAEPLRQIARFVRRRST
ncbi:MAG: polyprenyl synthetase family protein [Acidobacteriota bacterium]